MNLKKFKWYKESGLYKNSYCCIIKYTKLKYTLKAINIGINGWIWTVTQSPYNSHDVKATGKNVSCLKTAKMKAELAYISLHRAE